MSDNQKRLICRFLFLLTCVFPTSMVGYRLLHPETAKHWQTTIQSKLGVTTTVDSIETPGPYVTILRGLKFLDPELGTLLDATEVKIVLGKPNRIEIPHSVSVSNAGLLQLMDNINQHLIRTHAAEQRWQILFLGQTVIEDRICNSIPQFPPTMVAENLQIDVGPLLEGGTGALIQFRVPDLNDEKWVQFRVSRSLASDPGGSQQRLYLNTSDLELPCWLLGGRVPEIKHLGPRCQFAGEIDLVPNDNGVWGQMTGTFSRIELDGIAESKAQVRLCRFNGGIDQLDAFLILPDGSLSRIQETIEVVKRFDVIGAIRTAAVPDSFTLQADNHR
jgi:hypothetical protein